MNLLNNIEELLQNENDFIINNNINEAENEEKKDKDDKKDNKQKDKNDNNKNDNVKNDKNNNNKNDNDKNDNDKNDSDKNDSDNEDEMDFNSDVDIDDSNSNLTFDELGKVYQLKEIFNEILNLYDVCFKLLLFDDKMKYTLVLIKKLIDNYKFIINNIKNFKDKLNEIINQYRRIIINLYKYLNIKVNEIDSKVNKY